MAGPWSLDKLAAVAGETEGRIRRYVEAGLLHRQADGDFEPDSLHRLRLIQFVRTRGVSDEQLAAATASQGDLLGIFEELAPSSSAPSNLADAARELGLDDAVIEELAEILDWEDLGAGTEADVATLRVVAKALELGMPRDALMQTVCVLRRCHWSPRRCGGAHVPQLRPRALPRPGTRRAGTSGGDPARRSTCAGTGGADPCCISTDGRISEPTARICCAILLRRPHRPRRYRARNTRPCCSSIWRASPR